jgi:hypothetical protein
MAATSLSKKVVLPAVLGFPVSWVIAPATSQGRATQGTVSGDEGQSSAAVLNGLARG